MASSSNSKVKEVQQQVDDVKAVMCAAAERPCSSLHATLASATLRVICHLHQSAGGPALRAGRKTSR